MTGAAAFLLIALAAAALTKPLRPPEPRNTAAHDLIFLAENRPVFLRLRITSGGRAFEASWIDSVRTLYSSLDRNGDGTLTTKEADPAIVLALVRLAKGGCAAEAPGAGRPPEGRQGLDR